MEIFHDLGCVQIDPIRAVERTQWLVLWSRLGHFEPADLDALLWDKRQLFEYWAHCASIVMTADYPIYRLHMRDWLVGDKPWMKRFRKWLDDNQDLQHHILGELGQNGALTSRDFKDRSDRTWESSGWTTGQNVTQMLNGLWRLGQIMVSGRKGLTKYWDLSERCLPEWTPGDELDWPEAVRRAAQRSLRALGVARPAHIVEHFTRGRYPELQIVLDQLEAEGQVIQVQINEDGQTWPGNWYIHAEDISLLDQLEEGEWQPRTTLLSPFDNLICDRERTEELFDFNFRIEIYVPKAKRQYGYYVMPILHGDKLIGRLDPKMDRKKMQLQINAVYAEADAPMDAKTGAAIAQSIDNFAAFLGTNDINFDGHVPPTWKLT